MPFRSWHHSIVTLGLLPGLLYIPIWLNSIIKRILTGSSSVFLSICFVALGSYLICKERDEIKKLRADSEDRFVGYAFIISSVTMYVLFFSSPSLQALTWTTALIGVSLAVFGNQFIRKFLLAILMIALGLLPKYLELGYTVGKLILPNDILERFMAIISGYTLQLMGQPAVIDGKIIQLGSGAVNIADGCSGYSMAVILAGTGFVMGIFYGAKTIKIALLMLSGIVIALTINIPRIILLTYSVVYWGDDSFKFWHGGWGSQIIAGIMFTVFYYVSSAICQSKVRAAKPQ